MIASKICLIIDQDDLELKLLDGYKRFPCDNVKLEADHVKWIPISWHLRDREPSIEEINTWNVELEVHMSKSPYVQTVLNMDYKHFDYQSVSL